MLTGSGLALSGAYAPALPKGEPLREGARKNNLHRKEPVLALCGQGTFILLNDAVGYFDGVVGGTGVGRLRRAVGADDVHHKSSPRTSLPPSA